jgi:hypothetical protein
MSLIFATQLTAIATAVLAVFAILTTIYAVRAFRKQSQETRDQAEMLRVQSERLDVYRTAVDEQRQINATRVEMLELQAREIRASLEQRERYADEQRLKQTGRVTAWFGTGETPMGWFQGARIRNASDEPVYEIRVFFHLMHETDGSGRVPVGQGGPPPREITPVMPPGEDRFLPIPANVEAMFGNIPVDDKTCTVSIEFTDATGNRWEREVADRSGAISLGRSHPGL